MAWGESDCAQMVAAVCRSYGLPCPIEHVEPYSTEAQAYQRLLTDGYASLTEWMATLGTLVAPASAWPGDILGFEADDPRWACSLALMLTAKRGLALDPDTGKWSQIDLSTSVPIAAWRVF
jgi:hypothetical protein